MNDRQPNLARRGRSDADVMRELRELREELHATQQGLLALSMELEERVDRRTAALRTRARQQGVVARLGQEALETDDLGEVLGEAAHAVAAALGVEGCVVLQHRASGWRIRARAGQIPVELERTLDESGWQPSEQAPRNWERKASRFPRPRR